MQSVLKSQRGEAIQEVLMHKTGLHTECFSFQDSQQLFNQTDATALFCKHTELVTGPQPHVRHA